jgi:hypothetical protein
MSSINSVASSSCLSARRMPLSFSNPLLRELYSGADRYSSDSSASDSEDETPTPSDSSSLGGTSTSPVYPLSPILIFFCKRGLAD